MRGKFGTELDFILHLKKLSVYHSSFRGEKHTKKEEEEREKEAVGKGPHLARSLR